MSTKKIIITNALLITILIGGFFFLSKLLGLAGNGFLRFFNLVFVLIGIHQAIKTNIYTNKVTAFTTNLGVGIQTSALAVALSIVGVVVYLEVINPDFMQVIQNSFLIAGDLSLPEIVLTLVIEGFASSVIGSFIVMQFYKNHDKEDIS
ncbi:hypothetical protein [Polaribacter glomeratus]|uniref:DUF4199 domain-containing protein n=1 Tax=Polaribacter glomeratus TaxID=102 RepID=A0A2S7WXF3_9FLAO|nr:hypothetical protein [Polaribacter glomeratus]PQJ82269.1 hypothetical protein BTO16_06630 [Polaribacter glomeratus]TXD66864.1 hypothetical protein ESX12_04940 [Polaribacter glomeratus]